MWSCLMKSWSWSEAGGGSSWSELLELVESSSDAWSSPGVFVSASDWSHHLPPPDLLQHQLTTLLLEPAVHWKNISMTFDLDSDNKLFFICRCKIMIYNYKQWCIRLKILSTAVLKHMLKGAQRILFTAFMNYITHCQMSFLFLTWCLLSSWSEVLSEQQQLRDHEEQQLAQVSCCGSPPLTTTADNSCSAVLASCDSCCPASPDLSLSPESGSPD